MIEDEVGRPINYHSYPRRRRPRHRRDVRRGGRQRLPLDPQYNVIYRNINMVRSFVDACESKTLIAWAGMAQIDGAHNERHRATPGR